MKKLLTVTLCLLLSVSLFSMAALASGLYIEDPNTSNTFAATEDDGHIGFNFKSGGGAWVNIMNPWGKSAYMVMEPSQGFVQSMIITFKVDDYDGGDAGYRVMVGFGINGFSPSLWSLDAGGDDGSNWEEVYGERFDYFIEGDGTYKIIADFRGAMDWFFSINDWAEKEYLELIDCIELGIFSPKEDTTLKITILGVEETDEVFTLDHISRPLGSGKHFDGSPIITGPGPAIPPDDDPTPTPSASPDQTGSTGSSDGGGIDSWVWFAIGGGAIGAAVAVVIAISSAKKKK